MATCKDCIHFDVCDAHGDVAVEQNLPDVEKECDYFKDKADFLEVVRCKDCAYYVPLGDNYEYKGKKAMHCWLEGKPTSENYYCADGIRKDVTDINVGDKKE